MFPHSIGKACVRGGGQRSKPKHVSSTHWGSNCASGIDEEKATWFSDVMVIWIYCLIIFPLLFNSLPSLENMTRNVTFTESHSHSPRKRCPLHYLAAHLANTSAPSTPRGAPASLCGARRAPRHTPPHVGAHSPELRNIPSSAITSRNSLIKQVPLKPEGLQLM